MPVELAETAADGDVMIFRGRTETDGEAGSTAVDSHTERNPAQGINHCDCKAAARTEQRTANCAGSANRTA